MNDKSLVFPTDLGLFLLTALLMVCSSDQIDRKVLHVLYSGVCIFLPVNLRSVFLRLGRIHVVLRQ